MTGLFFFFPYNAEPEVSFCRVCYLKVALARASRLECFGAVADGFTLGINRHRVLARWLTTAASFHQTYKDSDPMPLGSGHTLYLSGDRGGVSLLRLGGIFHWFHSAATFLNQQCTE